jgi:hypothetical protein
VLLNAQLEGIRRRVRVVTHLHPGQWTGVTTAGVIRRDAFTKTASSISGQKLKSNSRIQFDQLSENSVPGTRTVFTLRKEKNYHTTIK